MSQFFQFGPHSIPAQCTFLVRKYVFAFPTRTPLVKGHVLVASRRAVSKLGDLTEIETIDLWMTANQVSRMVEEETGRECSITVQNGPHAGQSVNHVHLHVVPILSEAEQFQLNRREDGRELSEDELVLLSSEYRKAFNRLFS